MEQNSSFENQKHFRIKDGFILRRIAGEDTIIPADPDSDITNGVLSPNETAAFIWRIFQVSSTIEEAVRKVLSEYEVQEDTARAAVIQFIDESLQLRIMEEI